MSKRLGRSKRSESIGSSEAMAAVMATRNVDILAVTREIIHGYTATTVNQQAWNLLIWPDHLCKVLLPRGFSPYFFVCLFFKWYKLLQVPTTLYQSSVSIQQDTHAPQDNPCILHSWQTGTQIVTILIWLYPQKNTF